MTIRPTLTSPLQGRAVALSPTVRSSNPSRKHRKIIIEFEFKALPTARIAVQNRWTIHIAFCCCYSPTVYTCMHHFSIVVDHTTK